MNFSRKLKGEYVSAVTLILNKSGCCVIIYVIQEIVKMYNAGFRIKEEEDVGEEH